MTKEKRIPMRQCVGCREMRPKSELIRAVKPKDGELALDLTGKLSGRGAYICKKQECLDRTKKSKAIERALGCSISAEVYAELSEKLSEEKDG